MELHPNAWLSKRRNMKLGLISRTKILNALEKGDKSMREISEEIKISYARVLHHLHLLEAERFVERHGEKKPFRWKVTKIGQQRLA